MAREHFELSDALMEEMERPQIEQWVLERASKPQTKDEQSTKPSGAAKRKKRREAATEQHAPEAEAEPQTGKLSGAAKRKRKREEKEKARKELREFGVGQVCAGTVVSVQPIGAYIDIGAVRDGFCHVSRLTVRPWQRAGASVGQDGFCQDPKAVVKPGQAVQVATGRAAERRMGQARVLDVMPKKNKITLSLQSEAMIDKEKESLTRFAPCRAARDDGTPVRKKHAKKSPARQAARNQRRLERKQAAGKQE